MYVQYTMDMRRQSTVVYCTFTVPVDALDNDKDLLEGTRSARVALSDRLAQAPLERAHVVVPKDFDRGARKPHAHHQRRVVQCVRNHAAVL